MIELVIGPQLEPDQARGCGYKGGISARWKGDMGDIIHGGGSWLFKRPVLEMQVNAVVGHRPPEVGRIRSWRPAPRSCRRRNTLG